MSHIRITVSKETVNEMVKALQKAYKSGDAGMIKRISVLLDFSRGENVEAIAQRYEVSFSSIYAWIKKLLGPSLTSCLACLYVFAPLRDPLSTQFDSTT